MAWNSDFQPQRCEGPVVGPAVVAGLGSGLSVTVAGGIAFSLTTSGFLLAAGSSLVLGLVSRALSPSPPKLDTQGQFKSSGITRSVRQPITTRKAIYGEAQVAGPITFLEVSDDNKFIHIVVPVAGHEVDSIGEVWLNDYPITDDMLGGDNIVETGRS